MVEKVPIAELTGFSARGAQALEWTTGRAQLIEAPLYWLSTVRPTGAPHVTPVIGVWWNGALHFVTGAEERKAKNLADNRSCVLTTGCNAINQGLDLALEAKG
jgi:nitroimidazol reductase NimA-like FMN-containing flavoprotein (pyridoxamine 5'-phosphate oxidase superfamily)